MGARPELSLLKDPPLPQWRPTHLSHSFQGPQFAVVPLGQKRLHLALVNIPLILHLQPSPPLSPHHLWGSPLSPYPEASGAASTSPMSPLSSLGGGKAVGAGRDMPSGYVCDDPLPSNDHPASTAVSFHSTHETNHSTLPFSRKVGDLQSQHLLDVRQQPVNGTISVKI